MNEIDETVNERTVKWDKEQTRHLRERLAEVPSDQHGFQKAGVVLEGTPAGVIQPQYQAMYEENCRLREESAWIRKKLGLPEDTPMFSGAGDTLAGKLHVLFSHAYGYETYITSYRCNDKQGEISRLAAELAEVRHALEIEQQRAIKLVGQLRAEVESQVDRGVE